MGLQRNLTMETGLNLTEAYSKIVQLDLDLMNKAANILVHTFVNYDCRNDNKAAIKTDRYVLIQDKFNSVIDYSKMDAGQNIVYLVYEFLKTLPEYEGAIDISE
jgi:hypothetical protein